MKLRHRGTRSPRRYVITTRRLNIFESPLCLERGPLAGTWLGDMVPFAWLTIGRRVIADELESDVVVLARAAGTPTSASGSSTRLPHDVGVALEKILSQFNEGEWLAEKASARGLFATDREALRGRARQMTEAAQIDLAALVDRVAPVASGGR